MVESGPFIEYCGAVYVQLDAVLISGALLLLAILLVLRFCR